MKARVVLRVNAGIVLAIGAALLVPLAVSFIYGDGSWRSFFFPSLAMMTLGGAGVYLTRTPATRGTIEYVGTREIYFSVTLAWVLAALLGGVPFLIEGTFTSILDSSFETMSGFTTTGSTLLSDIEAETPSILFWRSMTQWLGGVGIVVLLVAVAPALGSGAARLLGAELSGLTQPRLTPRISDTAKALVGVYISISLAQTIALLIAGMNVYDAVVHTFTTVATGGFSPKTASIGHYDSVAVEAVAIFFMVVSGVSFSLYYLLYTRRDWRTLLDRELVAYLAIIAGSVVLVWGILVFTGDYAEDPADALRDSAFAVSSIITTTGFTTADFDTWDASAKAVLVALMFVGGCAGSTAGGIKIVRIMIVFRTVGGDVFRMIHPRAITPLRLGGNVIPEGVRLAVLALFAAWLITFAVATILVALQPNLTIVSAATAVAATLNVVGPGLGQVGASESYEVVNSFGRLVLTICMLLGRLEIFTALALLSPAFWRR
ncbi:MAG: TrkH family potassium uptake protein [Actinomycetota bacterium]|jgi:trk system potassium uptake protein TrkH|nr:TrkH family potassium uptake protein [Rubrobacter sp.]MDQ3509153.1 TrkH family potassium uptake protein [Actinomycetota bacterium]